MPEIALPVSPFDVDRDRPSVFVASGAGPYENTLAALAGLDLSPARGRRVLLKPNAGREVALGKGFRFLMETDYIDDLRRPGAVLGPKTVPKITKAMFDRGLLSVEQWEHIHIDLPEKTYGISLR